MSVVEDDPLAVLPVAAAAVSAAFARAADTTRGADERRLQLEALDGALVEAGRFLERGTSVVARLSAELDQSQQRTHPAGCPGAPPVCPLCLGVALTPSGGIAVCLRCGRVQELPSGKSRCAEPASVTVAGRAAEPRFLRRSHAATARQEDGHLQVVLASRSDRAALEEAARRSAVVGTRDQGRTAEAAMREHELRRLPVLVGLTAGAVLGAGRTTSHMMGNRLAAVPGGCPEVRGTSVAARVRQATFSR